MHILLYMPDISVFLADWHPSLSLSGILSMIIIRTLRKDIANYNREDDIVRKYTPDKTIYLVAENLRRKVAYNLSVQIVIV